MRVAARSPIRAYPVIWVMLGLTGTLSAQTWVVEDVIDPPTWAAGVSSQWWGARPQPNVKAGARGYLATGHDITVSSTHSMHLMYQVDDSSVDVFRATFASGAAQNPEQLLVLNTPGNPRLIGQHPSFLGWHPVVDAVTGTLVAQLPPIQHPVVGTLYPGLPHEAGDVDSDGFDDFFLDYFGSGSSYGHVAATSLVDGASLAVQWVTWEPGLEYAAYSIGPDLPPDLDGDGHPDHIIVARWINAATQALESKIVAVSGFDGAEAWRATVPGAAGGLNRLVPDVTGDGTADLVVSYSSTVSQYGTIRMLDGTDGSLVWESSASSAAPYFSNGTLFHVYLSKRDIMLGRDLSTGEKELVAIAYGSYLSGLVEWAYLHFDIGTGVLKSVGWDPLDLQPWSSDPIRIASGYGTFHFPIGDIDRDGLEENAAVAEAVGWPTNGIDQSQSLVIIGQETLKCPGQVLPGATMQLQIGIPSAGNLECVLLASTTFDGDSGLVVDGWKTNLAAGDPVLRATLQTRAYATTLDALGRGTIAVTVPTLPQLSGRTLYLRAVVLESGSTSDVWTLSSLGRVEVL